MEDKFCCGRPNFALARVAHLQSHVVLTTYLLSTPLQASAASVYNNPQAMSKTNPVQQPDPSPVFMAKQNQQLLMDFANAARAAPSTTTIKQALRDLSNSTDFTLHHETSCSADAPVEALRGSGGRSRRAPPPPQLHAPPTAGLAALPSPATTAGLAALPSPGEIMPGRRPLSN